MSEKKYRNIELIDHPKDYELNLVPKTDGELKQIAQDLWAGRIFTDRHIQDPARDIHMVFMPLVFMNQFQIDDIKKHEVNFIYEYLSEATPNTAINGMPIFYSMRMLMKPDTVKMFKYYEAVKKAMEEVKLDETKETT